MSVTRRSKLKVMVAVLATISLIILISVLARSMSPSAKARANYDLYHPEFRLELGGHAVALLVNKPHIVYRLSEVESERTKKDYVVVLALAQFKDASDRCFVEFDPGITYYNDPYIFREYCRGTWWDVNGDVLRGSHELALPLQQKDYTVTNGVLKIVADDI